MRGADIHNVHAGVVVALLVRAIDGRLNRVVRTILLCEDLAFFDRRGTDCLDDVVGFAVGAVEEQVLYEPLRDLACCCRAVSNSIMVGKQ